MSYWQRFAMCLAYSGVALGVLTVAAALSSKHWGNGGLGLGLMIVVLALCAVAAAYPTA